LAVASAQAAGTATDTTSNADSIIAPAGGLTAAWDYPVMRTLSFGIEANFMYAGGDIASTVFNGFGGFKYTF
jgi:hypothetical protein